MSIALSELAKNYGAVPVIENLSFDVGEGEFVSLLGPSGCGKTTTLRCIAGLEEPDGGSIHIGGDLVFDAAKGYELPVNRRNLGMVFQSYAIWPHMTVASNVSFPLRVRGANGASIAPQVERVLDMVGLGGLRDRYPSQLSGGQQQRVALARAVVGTPRILLFDEPLSNLDAKMRESMRAEIRRLQQELGVAALYVTHDQEEALAMSDRVIVMHGGKIMQQGTPQSLYHQPENRFVAEFIGKASFIPVVRGEQAGSFRTAGGQELRLEGAGSGGTGPLKLMVRPENLLVVGQGAPAPERDRDVKLSGKILDASYLGAFTEYHVEIGGDRILAHSLDGLPVGSAVDVWFSASRCRLIAG